MEWVRSSGKGAGECRYLVVSYIVHINSAGVRTNQSSTYLHLCHSLSFSISNYFFSCIKPFWVTLDMNQALIRLHMAALSLHLEVSAESGTSRATLKSLHMSYFWKFTRPSNQGCHPLSDSEGLVMRLRARQSLLKGCSFGVPLLWDCLYTGSSSLSSLSLYSSVTHAVSTSTESVQIDGSES